MKEKMQKKLWLVCLTLLCAFYGANAQTPEEGSQNPENETTVVAHTVALGETVMLIAKKYHIAPTDIYKLNPDAVNGISYNTVLQIPALKKYAARAKVKVINSTEENKNFTVTQTAQQPKG